MAAIDDIRLALRSIESLNDPESGEVRIGCTPALAESVATAVIDRLSPRYPRIVFRVISAYVEVLRAALNDRKVDLLIARRVGVLDDAQLGYEFLFNDPYVVVAGKRSPWIRRRGLTLAKLTKEPWTLPPPDSALGAIGMEAFRGSGLPYPDTAVVTDSAGVRTSLLATGRFLTIFPASVLKFPTRRPDLRALNAKLPIAPVPVGIFTLKNRPMSPVARLFVDCSREVSKPLASAK